MYAPGFLLLNQVCTCMAVLRVLVVCLCSSAKKPEVHSMLEKKAVFATGHYQPFVPAELTCILYLGCCLNVW